MGYSQLKVYLRSEPTFSHFDPEELRLSVAYDKGVDFINVTHPWTGLKQYDVAVGHVLFRDRKDKPVEAFTFGGQISIEPQDTQTTCILRSKAPICKLRDSVSVQALLARETDILLAERSVEWGGDDAGFEIRLATADPLLLYYACLRAMNDKNEPLAYQELEHLQSFTFFIGQELALLEKHADLPPNPGTLEDIL